MSTRNMLARSMKRVCMIVKGARPERTKADNRNQIAEIAKDGNYVGSSQRDRRAVEAFVMQFIAQRTTEGTYTKAEYMLNPKQTYDLMEGKETVF